MGYYWYFEFRIVDHNTGYEKRDHSIASSCDAFFPITTILQWKDEAFGECAKLFIETAFQISESMYTDMLTRIDVELGE